MKKRQADLDGYSRNSSNAGAILIVQSIRSLRIGAMLAIASFSVLAQQPAPGVDVSGDAQVIGIRYHCGSESSGCASVVTKEEFDALIQALDPNMTIDGRLSLAAEYSRVLIMAAEARRRGIDQLPEVQTLLKFSGLQVLANRLVREITATAPRVSSDEVEKYFRDHRRDYQEVSLSRILVSARPMDTTHDLVPAAARAEAVRARAINGEDFSALQREISGTQPGTPGQTVKIGPVSCLSVPEAHRQVCDLKPGEVSSVLPGNLGFFIYRLESRHDRELSEAGDEIRNMLERQRLQQEIEMVRTPVSLDLDERYFGKLPKPDLASKHGMHFPAARTTAPAPELPTHKH